MNLSRACDKAIEYGFYLLFFLVPLMMTPFNYELFEFNKMMLVYFLTTIIVSAWLIKMVMAKKFIFRRSFMDIPLIIFLISQFLSFLVSINRHTSLWGYYSRFHGGLLSTIAYLFLYWAFVSNLSRSKTLLVIRYILISAALVAAYGIAEHFGIDAQYWVQDVRDRVFSSLGQPNWLAAYLVALLPIPMAMILEQESRRAREQEKKKNLKLLLFYSFTLLLYICLLYTKSRSGLLALAIAYAVFWSLIFIPNLIKRKKPYHLSPITYHLKNFFLITFLLLLITLFIGTPWTPNLGQILTKSTSSPPQPDSQPTTQTPPSLLISESGDIRKIVWKGALEIWKHYPIFGTGVETFAYSYYWHRPREHNDVSEWDFLYNKAHNEYLNYLATAGIIGLGSYLLLIGAFIFWSLKQISNFKFLISKQIPNPKSQKKLGQLGIRSIRNLEIAFLAGYISILITNFFGFSVVAVALFFFLFPAMSLVLASHSRSVNRKSLPKWKPKWKPTYTLGFGQKLAIGAITFSLLASHYTLLKFWYADLLFAKGDKLNKAQQYDNAFNYLQRAVNLRPGEPFYHDALSISAANLGLTELAMTESDQTLKINPYHLNFWKNRTRGFYLLAEIDEKYNQQALVSLLTASELAPTDAKISYNLGLMYANIGQEETAIKTLEKTIQLKPNYRDARYALALFYEQKGDLEKARHQLEYILEKINPQDEEVKEKLESL